MKRRSHSFRKTQSNTVHSPHIANIISRNIKKINYYLSLVVSLPEELFAHLHAPLSRDFPRPRHVIKLESAYISIFSNKVIRVTLQDYICLHILEKSAEQSDAPLASSYLVCLYQGTPRKEHVIKFNPPVCRLQRLLNVIV